MNSKVIGWRISLALLALGFIFSAGQQAAAQTVGPGDVLFSEFRLSGPGPDGDGTDGFADEYMELYCNRDTACDISGYHLIAYDPSFGDFFVSFPAGVVIPARQRLLVGDDFGYSLFSYAAIDLFASFGGAIDFFVDNEGFQLTNAAETVVIDSVGFIGGGVGVPPSTINYIEGVGLQRAISRPPDQYAYVRKMTTATNRRPQDTNNNADDFVLVSVTGAAHPGIVAPPVLGAPGPQSTTSPDTFTLAQVPDSLVEPSLPSSASPNRVRVGGPNSGTLSIRRSFTNNTTETFSFLSFRLVEVTTTNSPNVSGGAQQARLHLITSPDAETFMNSQGRTVVIRGTVLEYDAGSGLEPEQPMGGGLNSSNNVNVGNGISPGETIDVQFLFNVVQSGSFRAYVTIEAFGSVVAAAPAARMPAATPKRGGTRRTLGPRTPLAAPKPNPVRRPGPLGRR